MADSFDLQKVHAQLRLLRDRTPDSSSDEHFRELTALGGASVFVSWFSGRSEWERHPKDDELVQVLQGACRLWVVEGGTAVPHELHQGCLIVVPQGAWHRFEARRAVYLLTVTTLPTEHDPDISRIPPDLPPQ